MRIPKRCEIELAAASDPAKGPLLYQIHHDAKAGEVFASDGKIYAVVGVDSSGSDTGPLDVAGLRRARKKSRSKTDRVEFCEAPSQVYPLSCPDYRHTNVPALQKAATIEIGLDVRLLVRLAKAIGTDGVRLSFSPDDPTTILVRPANASNSTPENYGNYGVLKGLRLSAEKKE